MDNDEKEKIIFYLIGDSHAANFYTAWGEKLNIRHKTLTGAGLQNVVRNNCRNVGADFQEYVQNIFEGLTKKSVIFLSFTDVDSRIGACERDYQQTLCDDQNEAILKIIQWCEPKKLYILDWYGVYKENEAHETKTSFQERVFIRRKIVNNLQKISERLPIVQVYSTVGDERFEDENGVDVGVLSSDKCHYDLDKKECKNILFSILENLVKENS